MYCKLTLVSLVHGGGEQLPFEFSVMFVLREPGVTGEGPLLTKSRGLHNHVIKKPPCSPALVVMSNPGGGIS